MGFENVTIKTVAERTGFSTTTVSRVLNGTYRKYRVSEITAAGIIAEAKKLGYIPNQAAVNLRKRTNNTIGLVVPSLSNPFFSTIASVISKAFYLRNYSVYMVDCDENEENERQILSSVSGQNLDGLIVIPSSTDHKHLDRLVAARLPIIFIDRYFEGLPIPYVSTNNYIGALTAVRLLASRGHEKIACIQGNPLVISNKERVRGYFDGISMEGLNYSYVSGSEFTQQAGYEEMNRILDANEKPTAIFAFSDTLTLGVLQALNERGLKVYDDISLLSFDNSRYLDFLETPITSIAQPVKQIAERAVTLLLERLDNPHIDQESILFAPKLIERKSIKNLNK